MTHGMSYHDWLTQAMVGKHDEVCHWGCGGDVSTYPKLNRVERAILDRLWKMYGESDA